MAPKRNLPRKHNPLLVPDKTPHHSELIKKRRLGQTTLVVKPGQIGTSNATKPQNLGVFDYAHLRAPLPENLKGSEIFAPNHNQSHPEAYFLMRRSKDGYVSATGMFKASYPWAKLADEATEREYLKTLPETSQDEVAGNVWVPESFALDLASDYGIVPWIEALLDPAPITKSTEDPKKAASIATPPKFEFSGSDKPILNPTPRGRGRPRAVSPSKVPSPRKQRTTKATNAANIATAREANATLQAALDDAASTADPEQSENEKVKVEVESAVETNGDVETTHTNVKVTMPGGSADLTLPESTEEMVAKAKEMVEEATKLEGISSSATKRKAEELDEESDSDADTEQPAKRTRLLEQEVKKQRVRNRAIIGVAATLAIGAIIPYVL